MKVLITTEQVDTAVAAAISEAGWDWEPDDQYGVPSPETCMKPIVLAALATLGVAEAKMAQP